MATGNLIAVTIGDIKVEPLSVELSAVQKEFAENINRKLYRKIMGWPEVEHWTQRLGDVEVKAVACAELAIQTLARFHDLCGTGSSQEKGG